jgi:hypothetical protein
MRVAEYLLEKGCDLDPIDENGHTLETYVADDHQEAKDFYKKITIIQLCVKFV